jgi:hypothetical protein
MREGDWSALFFSRFKAAFPSLGTSELSNGLFLPFLGGGDGDGGL